MEEERFMVLGNNTNLRKIKEQIKDFAFVFDIDNTLISEDGDVDETFFSIADTMIDKDIKLTFATGRSYQFCKEVVERVKTKLPIICFDGQVLCTSELVFYKLVFPEISKVCLEKMKKDFYIYFEDTYEIVTFEATGVLIYSLEFSYPRKRIRIDPNMHLFKPLRIYLRKKKNYIEFDDEKIKELICFNDTYVKVYPKGIWMSLYPEKADKVDACLELCKLQGIDISQVVFFGDDYNDLRLMQECGISIAMGNSISDIMEIADIKIGTVKERGVSTFLKQILGFG